MRSRAVRRSPATRFVLCAALTVVLTVASILLIDPMRAWINILPSSGVVYVAAKAEKQRGNTAGGWGV